MALPVIFRRAVGRDLAGAYWWYEERRRGLGEQFLAAVNATFDQIEQFPELFAVRYGHVRMAIVSRFPYAVFYRIDPRCVVVLTVLHTSDDPGNWPQAGGKAR
jgi:plasmid stabilization system protein ParE